MFLKCMFILNLFLWSFMENPFEELKRHATWFLTYSSEFKSTKYSFYH